MFTNQKTKLSILMLMLAFLFFSTCKKEVYNKVNTISDSSIVITNATPGSLESALIESGYTNITNLKITGKIDARDFIVMRLNMPMLTTIDLSETDIVQYSGKLVSPSGEIYSFQQPFPANTIPFEAFAGKVNVVSILLPNSLKAIDSYAFESCSDLKEITIPPSDTSIGISAFSACSSLTKVTIPSSVKRIMGYAFYSCKSLTSITIPSSVSILSESSFQRCTNLTSIIIPSSVTNIECASFAGCTSLSSITIPSSVSKIDSYAFSDCTSLQSIHINKEIPIDIGTNVFVNFLTSSCILYVPKGSKSTYQVVDVWMDFKNIIEE